MSDQAVGFLLEFRNEASSTLREAVSDFDSATTALEAAVDAAQAAYVFLENTTGKLSENLAATSKAVNARAGEVQDSIASISALEVQAPDTDPILEALSRLGDNIEAPLDPGVAEAVEDIEDLDIQTPSLEDFINFQQTLSAETVVPEPETAAYEAALADLEEEVGKSAGRLSETLPEATEALKRSAANLVTELTPNIEKFGALGSEVAKAIGDDAVEAYERLIDRSKTFIEGNADAIAKGDDVQALWTDFFAANEDDLRRVQDLLRTADKTDIKPIVDELVRQLGDAGLAEEFWKPIADNKHVDKLFFNELRDQFKKQDVVYKTWWDRILGTAKKSFWPKYEDQGERASGNIARFLGQKLRDVFASPIGQFVAALQLSNIITTVFGPALEKVTMLLQQLLLPFMNQLMNIVEAIRPSIIALQIALDPLAQGLGKVGIEIALALVPLFTALGELLSALTPILVMLVQIIAFALNLAVAALGKGLQSLTSVLGGVVWVVGGLFNAIAWILRPALEFLAWVGEATGLSYALGTVIAVLMIPAFIGWASTAIPAALAALWSYIAAMGTGIASAWGFVTANYATGMSILVGFLPAIGPALAAMWAWAVATWASAIPLMVGLIPALWGAVTATWAFTVALLANPIGLIVAAVIALIAVLIGLVWLLWEPIKKVFNAFLEKLQPIYDALQPILEFFYEWAWVIVLVALGPIGVLIAAVILFWDYLEPIFSAIWQFWTDWGGLIVALAFGPLGILIGTIVYFWDYLEPVFTKIWNFFVEWGWVILAVTNPIYQVYLVVSTLYGLFVELFTFLDEATGSFGLDAIADAVTWLTDWLLDWSVVIPPWIRWLFSIDETATPEPEIDTEPALDSIAGIEAAAQAEMGHSDAWVQSMVGVEDAGVVVADTASETFREAGDAAEMEIASSVGESTREAERLAGERERDAMEKLFGMGDQDLAGMMQDAGSYAGHYMLEGMADGMYALATAFPMASIFSLMFGAFSNVIARPADASAGVAPVAAMSVGAVNYEVDAEIKGEGIAEPIVTAINNMAYRMILAIQSANASDSDMELDDLSGAATI